MNAAQDEICSSVDEVMGDVRRIIRHLMVLGDEYTYCLGRTEVWGMAMLVKNEAVGMDGGACTV